jgi:hypothetical protein
MRKVNCLTAEDTEVTQSTLRKNCLTAEVTQRNF